MRTPIRDVPEAEPRPAPGPEPAWASARLAGLPRIVWLTTLAMVALMVGYSFLAPIFRNADEPAHVDLVLHLRDTNRYPDFDERFLSVPVVRSYRAARYERDPPNYGRLLAEQAPPRAQRLSFEQIGPDVPTTTRNHVANHPFLYYLLAGKALAVFDDVWPGADRWPYDKTMILMRLVGVALVAPLPLLAFAAARRLGATPAQCLAAALFPVINPWVIRQGSSVNNDALLMLLAAALTLLLVRVWTGDRSARTAALVGVVLGLALLTKGLALALVPWVGLAYARAWWRGPRRPAVTSALLALGLAALLGGWWWLRNLLVFGTVQTGLSHRTVEFEASFSHWLQQYAWRTTAHFWAYFGQLHVALDRVLIIAPIVLATAVTVVGAVASLRARRPQGWTPAATAFLLWPIVGVLAIVAPNAYASYTTLSYVCCAQGRYLFSGLVALALLVAVGWGWLLGRRDHLLPVGLLAVGGLLHGVAVLSLLNLYWGPMDPTLGQSLEALAAWTPWRARPTALLLVACALVVAGVAVRLVAAAVRAAPARPAGAA